MFEMVNSVLKIDRPKWLELFVVNPPGFPTIRGATTLFSSQGQFSNWSGVCTSNGGNFDAGEGNIIEVDVTADMSMYARATVPGTNEIKEFYIIDGVAEMDEELINSVWEDIHSLPEGPDKPQKPEVSAAWESGNQTLAPNSFNPNS
jgi:hypothetical protein